MTIADGPPGSLALIFLIIAVLAVVETYRKWRHKRPPD